MPGPDDVTVYSAVFGGYDRPCRPEVPGTFVLFTDSGPVEGWQVWSTLATLGPRRTARQIKTTAAFSPYSLWLDGNIALRVPPEQLIAEWLGEEYDIALFRHPAHDSTYTEALTCAHKRKDDKAIIDAQMARYRAAGFPARYGLGETCVLARRDTPEVREFMARWWLEISRGSVRDQLSFDYVRWQMEDTVRVHLVDGGPGWRRRQHPWFESWPHGNGQA